MRSGLALTHLTKYDCDGPYSKKQREIQVAGVGQGGESKGPSLSALEASKRMMWVLMCLLAVVVDSFFLGSMFSDVPIDHTRGITCHLGVLPGSFGVSQLISTPQSTFILP